MKYALGNMLNGAGGFGLDSDAKAYINAVVAAGATVTTNQLNAINTFVKGGKTDGWWASMKRIYLPIWAIASPNAIDMVGRTSGTFAGTVTHASGYVQGDGSTGLFRYNSNPSALGMLNSSGFSFVLCNQATTIDGSHTGVLEIAATQNRCTISCVAGTSLNSEYVSFGAAANAGVARSNQTGIMCFSRTSTASLVSYQRKTSGISLLVTSTVTETGNVPTISVCAMARGRSATTQDQYSNGRYGAYGIGLGLSQTNVEKCTLAVKNLWETCTGLILP